jgi:hypothetical protein
MLDQVKPEGNEPDKNGAREVTGPAEPVWQSGYTSQQSKY